ncbi:UV radiation resistance protein autophagy-related protein 14 [Ceratocystis lukuohia]|uniref:Autophagy-related protein 14 n=1 Tax=Ceratocystis lukuohia TaxID=2019550 RepID=A0ABR4ML09_9PEZI
MARDTFASRIDGASLKQDKFMSYDKLRSETEIACARTKSAKAAAAALRSQISIQREHMAAKKAFLEHRRDDLTAAGLGLEARRAHQMDETRRVIGDVRAAWANTADDLVRTRAFLCREAAKLFGPIRLCKPETPGKWAFEIGHLEVVDITNMNNYTPEYISTSLANVAHLLVLIAHYLSVRLPAEITLPHKDYPRPTIFPIESSYASPLPGSSIPSEKSPSACTSREPPPSPSESSVRVQPRPLFITKPLAMLYKDDPESHSAFIEACALLAYNVAWLCISQGMVFSDRVTLDEATNMGLNLYTLLFSERPPILSGTASATFKTPTLLQPTDTQPSRTSKPEPNLDPVHGRFSHGTACNFLHAVSGFNISRMSKFPMARVIHDRLLTKLVTDLALPEWELLDTHEWQVEDAPEEADAVLVSATMIPEARESNSKAVDGNINASPWTKVRGYGSRK